MQLNSKGKALIQSYESLQTKAYRCPAGIWTIGYGHTKTAKPGQVITLEQADDLFDADVKQFEQAVNKENLSLTQNQFDALVSFAFNVGEGNFQKSTLLKKAKINANDASIRTEFEKWNKSKGRVLPGLTRRRKAEADLYFTK